jgi:hypothetical protein
MAAEDYRALTAKERVGGLPTVYPPNSSGRSRAPSRPEGAPCHSAPDQRPPGDPRGSLSRLRLTGCGEVVQASEILARHPLTTALTSIQTGDQAPATDPGPGSGPVRHVLGARMGPRVAFSGPTSAPQARREHRVRRDYAGARRTPGFRRPGADHPVHRGQSRSRPQGHPPGPRNSRDMKSTSSTSFRRRPGRGHQLPALSSKEPYRPDKRIDEHRRRLQRAALTGQLGLVITGNAGDRCWEEPPHGMPPVVSAVTAPLSS